jgi:hypothetical protein
MTSFVGLFGLLFALFFGLGGGASEGTGWTNYVPLAEPPVDAESGPSPGSPEAPPIVLRSRAGRQNAVITSATVETASSGSAVLARLGVERVSVVRPGESVLIAMEGIRSTQRLVIVRQLGCDRPALASAVLDAGTERWSVPQRPGAYELEVTVPYFKPKRGGTGSATGLVGVLVDPTRELAVIPAARDLFVCPPRP